MGPLPSWQAAIFYVFRNEVEVEVELRRCTEGRTRTGTSLSELRILSPVRLPIPPPRQVQFPAQLPKTEYLEAPGGFEPSHKGFADLSLTTWVRRR